jgi:symplekin
MNAGDAADQVIRQVDKMIKSGDRFTRDARVSKASSSDLLFLFC